MQITTAGASVYLAWMGGMLMGVGLESEPSWTLVAAGVVLTLAPTIWLRRAGLLDHD